MKKGGFVKNQNMLQPSNKNKVLYKSFNEKIEKESVKEAQSMEREYNRVLNNLDDKSVRTTEVNNDTKCEEDLSERWKKILVQSNPSQANAHRRKITNPLATQEDESCASNKNPQKLLKKEDFAENSMNYEFVSPEADKFKLSITSDKFFVQESHSIIPFLLISNKEIHRVCISDFEIKQNYPRFQKKVEYQTVNDIDYYHKGLINFYLGNYSKAFEIFSNGYKLFPENMNLAKWLAFSCIVLIFCDKNIDFSKISTLKINEDSKDRGPESSNYSFCILRKSDMKIDNMTRDKAFYCQICEELLEKLISNTKTQIEGWWMHMIVGIYCKLNFFQSLFVNPYEPLYSIKQIRASDNYLSYLAFSEYKRFTDADNYNPHEFYNDILKVYPLRYEAYYSYWQLLVKGRYKDFKAAHFLAEKLWRNSSEIKLDYINTFIVFMLYSKSYYLIGNTYFSLNLFQYKYLSNLHYPALYYLLGKYLSKSDIKEGLKYIAISTLNSVYPLLYEDLQNSVLFYIGDIYYNSGSFKECYDYWKKFAVTNEKNNNGHNGSHKKMSKIISFFSKFEFFCTRFTDFIKYILTFKIQENNNTTDVDFKKINNDLNTIKNRVPNIKDNYAITYEYLRGLIQLYVQKNYSSSLRIFINIIHKNSTYMPAHFALWDLIKLEEDYKFLLKFSLYTLKIAHSNGVELNYWINAYYNYAKALVLNNENDDAIKLLIIMLDNFASIKLDDIKYLNSIYKENKINHTHDFKNFDHGLNFYSKNHIFDKAECVFKKHYKFKKNEKKDKGNSDKILTSVDQSEKSDQNTIIHSNNSKNTNPTSHQVPEIPEINNDLLEHLGFLDSIHGNSLNYCVTEPQFLNTVDDINDNTHTQIEQVSIKKDDLPLIDESVIEKEDYDSDISLADLEITEMHNFEKFIDKNLQCITINIESPYNKILYHIGKLSAISQSNYQIGATCLQEYIKFLVFENNYTGGDDSELKKSRAFFWLAIIHMNLGELTKTEYIFQIILQNEINLNFKKMNLIHKFMDSKIAITYNKSYFL